MQKVTKENIQLAFSSQFELNILKGLDDQCIGSSWKIPINFGISKEGSEPPFTYEPPLIRIQRFFFIVFGKLYKRKL